MSVIKPFSGIKADAPSDCAVIRPDIRTWKGLAVSHGLVPRYSDIDTYHMTCNVMDEAIRSLVAVGADPDTALGLDNFCWPDPVATAKNPLGEYKMAQLVRSNKALRDMALATNIPCISGKDSMKNDYVAENIRISIPPTLLYTALAVIPDVRKSVTMDFKDVGDVILLVGETRDELGASELYSELGLLGQNVPVVDAKKAMGCYRKVHAAIQAGLIRSAHDLSEGGLLVSLAESCFGGRCGADIQLPKSALHPVRQLFSESASRLLISCRPEKLAALKSALAGETMEVLGKVAAGYTLNVAGQSLDLHQLYRAWRQPLSSLE